MRQQTTAISIIVCLCGVLALINAVPLPANDQELDVLQIPISNDKELDVLTLGARDEEALIADRNKRTVGLLRELFPDITKNGATDTSIDLSAINKQLEETIRVARQVKEAEAAAAAAALHHQQQQQQQQQQLQQLAQLQPQQLYAQPPQQQPLPQLQPQQQQQQTGGVLLPSIPQQLPIPKSNNEPIQLSFNNEVVPSLPVKDSSKPVNNALQQTESKSPAIDELSLDSNEDTVDLDDRNKRFLNFGGAGLAGGSSSGSSGSSSGNSAGGSGGAAPGGSGNFLFDIVRLFSGSVQTQQGDEAANSANSVGGSDSDSDSDSDANRAADGYTEGIPGPVTRLVVLANRGLANLIQDLILRIAATSEKFVNFKAKLITALI